MKKKKEGAKMVLPGWFASYADMVTVLMVFFILLFTMSMVDEAKFEEFLAGFQGDRFGRGGGDNIFSDVSFFEHPEQPLPTPEPFPPEVVEGRPPDANPITPGEVAAEMANAFRTYLAPYAEGHEFTIFIPEDAEYIRITMIDGGVFFAPGQVALLPAAIAMIDQLAPVLVQYAELGHYIIVEGHADNVPMNPGSPFVNNMGLSAMRASSVATRLIDYWGIPGQLIESRGRGEYFPIDTNDTPEGRANNRRVDLKIMTTTTQQGTGAPFNIPGID